MVVGECHCICKSSFRRKPESRWSGAGKSLPPARPHPWIPAFAGMTIRRVCYGSLFTNLLQHGHRTPHGRAGPAAVGFARRTGHGGHGRCCRRVAVHRALGGGLAGPLRGQTSMGDSRPRLRTRVSLGFLRAPRFARSAAALRPRSASQRGEGNHTHRRASVPRAGRAGQPQPLVRRRGAAMDAGGRARCHRQRTGHRTQRLPALALRGHHSGSASPARTEELGHALRLHGIPRASPDLRTWPTCTTTGRRGWCGAMAGGVRSWDRGRAAAHRPVPGARVRAGSRRSAQGAGGGGPRRAHRGGAGPLRLRRHVPRAVHIRDCTWAC